MKCPYCNKEVYGLTGLQELQKFQKHLQKCINRPDRKLGVDNFGRLEQKNPYIDMGQALKIRHDSGQ